MQALLTQDDQPGHRWPTRSPSFPAAFGAAGALTVDKGTHLYQLLQVAFALRNPETTTVPIANANHRWPSVTR